MANGRRTSTLWGPLAFVAIASTVLSLPDSSRMPVQWFARVALGNLTCALGQPCNDGNICTTGDICVNGLICAGTPFVPPACNDGNPCTDDGCDPAANGNTGGCTHTPNNSGCDDGNLCTQNDQCSNSSCAGTAFVPSACDDGNPCTDDGCDSAANSNTGGCTHTPNNNSCNAGNLCTHNDQCSNSACTGTAFVPQVCFDNNPLTTDGCNAAANANTGACTHTLDPVSAPAMSPFVLGVVATLLGGVAVFGLRRQSRRDAPRNQQ